MSDKSAVGGGRAGRPATGQTTCGAGRGLAWVCERAGLTCQEKCGLKWCPLGAPLGLPLGASLGIPLGGF